MPLFETVLATILNAMMVGVGTALGSYLANRGLISKLERLLNNKIEYKK